MLFQKKYSLSHTQMDLMAYFVNLAFWTIIVEGYYVIATKKIMSDLPEMGQKTIEASLKRLKEIGLIEPICNFVPTWLKETTFYINSYNKLALVTPKGEYKQLVDPIVINRFWHWLFEHQHRVADVINFGKPLDLKALKERYLGGENHFG